MGKLKKVIESIKEPDYALAEKTQIRLNNLTKPLGSLGKLEELAKDISGMSAKLMPVLKNKVIFTLASDHGVTDEGISAYPKAVTAQMVYNFLKGGAGINVLGRHAGARVIVVDIGVAEDIEPVEGLVVRKMGYGTKNIAIGSAMTYDEAVKTVETGMDIFEDEFKKGIDIICTGEMRIGNTTSSSAITAVFTRKPVVEITGKGAGIDDKALLHKIKVIEKAIAVNRPNPDDAIDVLSKVGGFEIAGLTGIILASAANRVPVVIDGFISGAAALAAYRIAPLSKKYMIASHCSVEKGHKIILDELGLKPILDLNLRLGEGTGAALALCIVEAATKILCQMATFENAKVSKKIG
jgi:nicotinate-nucleotide--dimethylbenzimidazole phosphoribosyltransferase